MQKSIPFRTILAALVILAVHLYGYAQPEIRDYPVQFSQYLFSYPLINPASSGAVDGNEITMGYQKPVSGFSGVSTYYLILLLSPGVSANRTFLRKSKFGLQFYDDHEGPYINRGRFYGSYVFHTPVSTNMNFSGGIDIGGMNYSVKPTPTTGGSSVFRIDANAGVWFYNQRFHTGISVNQIFNSILKPIEEETILPTYVNLSGSYTFIREKNISVSPHILLTFPYYDRWSIRGSLYGLFYDRFIAVLGWNRKTNLSYMIGLNHMHILGNSMDLILSYNTSCKKASIGINQWEICLTYLLERGNGATR